MGMIALKRVIIEVYCGVVFRRVRFWNEEKFARRLGFVSVLVIFVCAVLIPLFKINSDEHCKNCFCFIEGLYLEKCKWEYHSQIQNLQGEQQNKTCVFGNCSVNPINWQPKWNVPKLNFTSTLTVCLWRCQVGILIHIYQHIHVLYPVGIATLWSAITRLTINYRRPFYLIWWSESCKEFYVFHLNILTETYFYCGLQLKSN